MRVIATSTFTLELSFKELLLLKRAVGDLPGQDAYNLYCSLSAAVEDR